MLNYLWAGMILVGIGYAIFTGNIGEITDAAMDSAGEGISLCITMAGVMAFWMGLMKIAEEAGLVQKLTRGIMPFLRCLFPRIPKGHKSLEYIAINMVTNILGLGWACTPAGLKAMEELAHLEEERGNSEYCGKGTGTRTASNEMCIFLIVNISSLQLIPINVIAYRSQYGSVNPAAIIGPAIIATVASAMVGILFCMVKNATAGRNS